MAFKLLVGAGNRDPRHYDDPETTRRLNNITRPFERIEVFDVEADRGTRAD